MRLKSPVVLRYKVVLGNGSVIYPKLPKSSLIDKVAMDYALSKGTYVVNIEIVY